MPDCGRLVPNLIVSPLTPTVLGSVGQFDGVDDRRCRSSRRRPVGRAAVAAALSSSSPPHVPRTQRARRAQRSRRRSATRARRRSLDDRSWRFLSVRTVSGVGGGGARRPRSDGRTDARVARRRRCRRAARTSSRISAMPKIAGESSFARFGSENRSLGIGYLSIRAGGTRRRTRRERAEHRRGAADHDRDEELDRELERLDLVGARRARSTSTEHEPAMPAYSALSANASTLTCARLMPTVSAAASWSRTAISDRPKRLRAMSTTTTSSRRSRRTSVT